MNRKIIVFSLVILVSIGFTAGCIDGVDDINIGDNGEEELELVEFKFVEDQEAEDPDNWVEREAEYQSNEIYIYKYFSVDGFEVEDNVAEYHLDTKMYHEGEHIPDYDATSTDTLSPQDEEYLSAQDEEYAEILFSPSAWSYDGWETGTWEFEVIVTDKNSGEELEFTKTLEIV
ncbi:hypothetical protein [Methanonatronarchaeum sp. AMET-Sl]|uniref:hypothetical protein n=1 Tax=Methanonatronarchaeum sp. AMET-Sl TaxID=3037654 RepID=UPI00244DEF34|nr:hypothetical protein [Methanonatronarchaeum sp. AMET-Sl]WGI18012.1 hypothetical protein QEN48_03140 [Methanonatronarchaeum sp. AMET-Sl]